MQELYLFDKSEALFDVISAEEMAEHTQISEIKGLVQIIAQVPFSGNVEKAVYVGHKDVDQPDIFHMYVVDRVKKEHKLMEIRGTHVFFDDLKGYGVLRDKRPQNVTVSRPMNDLLEGSRWKLGTVDSSHIASTNFYYESRLEAFWKTVETWNVEFRLRMTFSGGKIVERFIDVADRFEEDHGRWYEYGDKLLTVVAETSREKLYTAFLGRGKGEEIIDEETGEGTDAFGRRIRFDQVEWSVANGDPIDKPLGSDVLEIPWATEKYGYADGTPRTQVVEFHDIDDPSRLLQATHEYAVNHCRPQVEFSAEVFEDQRLDLGETVAIIRPDLDIRYKTRVFKVERDFLSKGRKTIEFGDKIAVSSAKMTASILGAIKTQEDQTLGYMQSLHQQLTDSYFNEDGYNYDLRVGNPYNLPGGYYSFNAPIDQDPTKVIYIGAGTMAIANSKNPDGSWRFRTWGTGDGFVADEMRLGTLRGGKVAFDLEAGTFLIGDSTSDYAFYWDGSGLYANGTHFDLSANVGLSNASLTAKINDGTSNIRISADKVQIDGNTTIANATITSAMIADGAITNLKVGDLSADKITYGTLQSRYGGTSVDISNGDFNFKNGMLTTGTAQDGTTALTTNGTVTVNRGSNILEMNAGGYQIFTSGGSAIGRMTLANGAGGLRLNYYTGGISLGKDTATYIAVGDHTTSFGAPGSSWKVVINGPTWITNTVTVDGRLNCAELYVNGVKVA